MTRSVKQFNSRTETGEPIPLAEIAVVISGGAVANIYANPTGGVPLVQPLIADATGFVRFYVEPGLYDITSTDPILFSFITHTNVEIGTSRESLIDDNQHAKPYSPLNKSPAVDVTYDNSTSLLTAMDAQAAIDEVNADKINSTQLIAELIADLSQAYTFKTVALMQASLIVFPVGKKLFWQGYYVESDGGYNWGIVKAGAGIEDGGSEFDLADGKHVDANLKGEVLNALKFGAKGVGVAFDDHLALQTGINYAINNGLQFYAPAGRYYVTQSLVIKRPSGEYRADSFIMKGDGSGNIFLGYTLCDGTVIFTDANIVVLSYPESILNGFNHLNVSHMRLQQTNVAATSPVINLGITTGYSHFSYMDVKQDGLGHGIVLSKSYLTEFSRMNVANSDFVDASAATVRTGIGIYAKSQTNGGLLTLRKITARGWLDGYLLGDDVFQTLSAKMDQCECSTVTNGITIGAAAFGTTMDTCFFEGVFGDCIIDKGQKTTVSNSFFNSYFDRAINATNTNNFGGLYFGNTIFLSADNQIGIDIYADGDALGHSKVVRDNYIYFITSGGSDVGVNGVKLTGSNPSINIESNTFRPRREWVGGAGTVKFNNASTGVLTGSFPVTDALNEFNLLSNVLVAPAQGTTLTEANVVGGVLTLGAGSYFIVNFSVPTNVTSLNVGGKMQGR